MSQPPFPSNYPSQTIPPQGASSLATAAMVIGIVGVCLSALLFCFPYLGMLVGVVALVLGAVALSQGNPASSGRAKTGLILGIIAVVVGIGWIIAIRAGLSFLQKKGTQLGQQFQQQAEKVQKEAEKAQKEAEKAQKDAEEAAKKAQQQSPSTGPGTLAPGILPWEIASINDQLPSRTLYLVVPQTT